LETRNCQALDLEHRNVRLDGVGNGVIFELAFLTYGPENLGSCMQPERTSTDKLFDFLGWAYANRQRLIIALAALLVLGAIIGLASWRKDQNETTANIALFQLPSPLLAADKGPAADPQAFLKIADDYAKTDAGKRAFLYGAAQLFTQGKYSEAQAQFEKFLKENPDGPLAAEADLSVAACLEAQGKAGDSINRYRDLISRYASEHVVPQARLNMARLLEAQGKPEEALRTYETIVRPNPNAFDLWSAEATERKEKLLIKFPNLAKPPATAPPAPALTVPAAASNVAKNVKP
jgi:TolA-binding protein